MISSLYIIDYLNKLAFFLDKENIPYFENPIHVPGGSASDFMDYLAKREIINANRKPNDPVLVIGWDKGPTNRNAQAHPHQIRRWKRDPNEGATYRHAIQAMFSLSIFCITNKSNLAEDLEEVYATIIRPRTSFEINTQTIYELDVEDFGANMLHGDISTTCLTSHGNIWGVSWSVNLFGEIVNLNPEDAARCKKLSVELYENNLDLYRFINKISINNLGEFILNSP